MQKITGELIEKFFRGDCTEEEAAMVLKYLKENPDDQYLLREWENTDDKTPLQPGYSAAMLEALVVATTKEKSKRKTPKLIWLSVAACLFVMIAIGWLLNNNDKKPQPIAINKTQPESIWIEKSNKSDEEETVSLPDHSRITLSQNTSIRFKKDFNVKAREIYLTGEAVFEVVKNEQRPFIVYAEEIITKDLGTIFRVTAYKNASQVKVKLYEGKVDVFLSDSKNIQDRDYLLSPGDEFVFDTKNKKVTINSVYKKNKTAVKDTISNYRHERKIDNVFMFNNETLPEVFDQLSAMYNVPIHYSKKELNNIYFIGKIEPSDPLEKIINDISVLNHLSVTKDKGAYIIKKKSTKH